MNKVTQMHPVKPPIDEKPIVLMYTRQTNDTLYRAVVELRLETDGDSICLAKRSCHPANVVRCEAEMYGNVAALLHSITGNALESKRVLMNKCKKAGHVWQHFPDGAA